MFIFVTEQTDLKRNGILSVNSAKQEMSFKQPCLFSNKSNSKTLQQNACLHENFSANVQKIKIDKKNWGRKSPATVPSKHLYENSTSTA